MNNKHLFHIKIGTVEEFNIKENYQDLMDPNENYEFNQSLDFAEFKDAMEYEYSRWRLVFGDYQDIVLNVITELMSRVIIPKKDGLIKKFVALQTPFDISIFSQNYGMLELTLSPLIHESIDIEDLYAKKGMAMFVDNQVIYHEPLALWYFFIDHAKRVFRLYQELIKANMDKNYTITSIYPVHTSDPSVFYEIEYRWWDGKSTNYFTWTDEPQLNIETSLLDAQEILIEQILSVIKNDDIVPTTITTSENNPIGFSVKAIQGRSSVLRHMYYELWELLTSDGEIKVCENPNCLLPNKNKRKRYCDDACKQEAYRLRKEKGGE